ncbi:hypothetical protein [Kaistella haifensis]|nr:hypothetical protein [Kaistella haifensis]
MLSLIWFLVLYFTAKEAKVFSEMQRRYAFKGCWGSYGICGKFHPLKNHDFKDKKKSYRTL